MTAPKAEPSEQPAVAAFQARFGRRPTTQEFQLYAAGFYDAPQAGSAVAPKAELTPASSDELIDALAERFWRLTPQEVDASGLKRRQFYAREMKALFAAIATPQAASAQSVVADTRIRKLVEGLADQQAIPDDWWKAELEAILAAPNLEAPRAPVVADTPTDEQIMEATREFAADGGRWPSDWIAACRAVIALASPPRAEQAAPTEPSDCDSCAGTGSGGMGVGCTDCLGTGIDPQGAADRSA